MVNTADISTDSSSKVETPVTMHPGAGTQGAYFSDIKDNLKSTLYCGLGTGFVGLFYGASRGMLKSGPPVLFAVLSGIHWFVLGSSYTFARRSLISSWGGDNIAPIQKTAVSAVAGGFAGGAVGSLRGLKTIPGSIIPFALVGGAGQYIYGCLEGFTIKPKEGWLESKYSPLVRVSDEEYSRVLEEKLLGARADIAILDEKIEAARARVKARRENSGADIVRKSE